MQNIEPDETRNKKELEGRYANYFKIGHNAFEFVLDFGQFYPEQQDVQFHTRIITSPAYARALLKIFRESIEQFEEMFGEIKEE